MLNNYGEILGTLVPIILMVAIFILAHPSAA